MLIATAKNLKKTSSFILETKKREFNNKVFGGWRCPVIVSTQYGVGMGVGKGGWGLFLLGCSLSGFPFSACVTFYLAFENQNDGRYKNTMKRFFWKNKINKRQNTCFKKNSRKCKVLLSERVLLSRLGFLVVTIKLTFSECNFTHSYIG